MVMESIRISETYANDAQNISEKLHVMFRVTWRQVHTKNDVISKSNNGSAFLVTKVKLCRGNFQSNAFGHLLIEINFGPTMCSR